MNGRSMTEGDGRLNVYVELTRGLRQNWTPHDGQRAVGRKVFAENIKSVFVQCGRKWGKTEFALDCLWNIAFLYPNSPCYFIAPFQTQAREIVWADPRVKEFGPRSWLKDGSAGINNSELRLNFKNGSFIKIDGSDNFEKYRGPRFKVCIYEEYKDHRPEFRRAMRPNASVLDGWEIFIGSPPDRECDYTVLADDHKTDPLKFFYQAPTHENPHISMQWLEQEKRSLYMRGEGDLWEREYMARFVPGGATKIFPMISRNYVTAHDNVMALTRKDKKKLEWFWFADPAAASCFAVLFVAINPYTKTVYCLDEIYETDQAKMTVKQIGHRVLDLREEFWDGEWRQGYDEAETWFRTEFLDHFDERLEPSYKAQHDKEAGLSLIKDIMLGNKLIISDRCQKLFWEMDNYYKTKQGRIPKEHDHLIDCLRYILGNTFYALPEMKEPKPERHDQWMGESLERAWRENHSKWYEVAGDD